MQFFQLRARTLLEEAATALQLRTSSWQDESPYTEELELLRVSGDMRLDGMRQAIKTGKAGDWSELAESDRLTEECYSEVMQEDEERKGIVQQILQQSTDFPSGIIVPV